jgi:hypothetical protein
MAPALRGRGFPALCAVRAPARRGSAPKGSAACNQHALAPPPRFCVGLSGTGVVGLGGAEVLHRLPQVELSSLDDFGF